MRGKLLRNCSEHCDTPPRALGAPVSWVPRTPWTLKDSCAQSTLFSVVVDETTVTRTESCCLWQFSATVSQDVPSFTWAANEKCVARSPGLAEKTARIQGQETGSPHSQEENRPHHPGTVNLGTRLGPASVHVHPVGPPPRTPSPQPPAEVLSLWPSSNSLSTFLSPAGGGVPRWAPTTP